MQISKKQPREALCNAIKRLLDKNLFKKIEEKVEVDSTVSKKEAVGMFVEDHLISFFK